MASYDLSKAAEDDLKQIAIYTGSKWGVQQALRYGAILDDHLESVGNGNARTRLFLQHRPELRISRIEHHYVFHLEQESQRRLIIAVLHESTDLLARLRSRLEL